MTRNISNRLLLYAITIEHTELKILLRQVEETLSGGATILQLREKSVDEEEYCRRAIEVKKICDQYDVPLIIDDSINVALRCDAAGAHIGQQDVNIECARKLLGADRIIGVSAKNVDQARRAEPEGG